MSTSGIIAREFPFCPFFIDVPVLGIGIPFFFPLKYPSGLVSISIPSTSVTFKYLPLSILPYEHITTSSHPSSVNSPHFNFFVRRYFPSLVLLFSTLPRSDPIPMNTAT
ncbi:hypothetical protein QCA50_006788 [Cerrena zonata]|uniref:Uncharacterized protein n=1 Tax=Cerrena zonata TaxID=2478898 RepID=A0AAW0GFZ7_9APHY